MPALEVARGSTNPTAHVVQHVITLGCQDVRAVGCDLMRVVDDYNREIRNACNPHLSNAAPPLATPSAFALIQQ